MAVYKNVASQKIAVYAYDTANDEPKTGDAANITAQISLDGAATAATNDTNPTELDATDAPGIYLFDMTQAETNADMIVLYAKSSSTDIVLEPVIIYTTPGDNAALTANVTEIGGDTQSATDLKDFADTGYDPTSHKVAGVVLVDTTTTNTDMRGTDSALLATSAPANFGDLAITATTGRVTVGTNNDKTGYSLTNLTVESSTTLKTGSHYPQSGDAYAYLGTNLGSAGAAATEAGGTGDHLTAITVAGFGAGSITNAAFANNAIDADVLASDTITAAKIADNAIGTSELATSALTAIADQVLTRDASSVEDSANAYSLGALLLTSYFGSANADTGQLVVTKTDGATAFNTYTISVDTTGVVITSTSGTV